MQKTCAFVVLLNLLATIQGENKLYHEQWKQQFSVKDIRNGSLFGYSLSYVHYNKEKKLVVGCPKSNEQGDVFTCDVNRPSCERLPIKPNNIERGTEEGLRSIDFWLGASVNAGNDFILGCAPRYSLAKYWTGKGFVGTFGRCYVHYLKDATPQMAMISQVNENKIHDYSKKLYGSPFLNIERIMDSFGWSTHVSQGGIRLVVGGPAMVNGRAIGYTRDDLTSDDPQLFETPLKDAQFNFGYSITSGKFSTRKSVIYAISSPYGDKGKGMIKFFDKNFQRKKKISDGEVGELYGAALCTVNLGLELDALLVGSPAWINTPDSRSFDVGAVYLYTFRTANDVDIVTPANPSPQRIVIGYKDGGYFGAAIASVGDLTGDRIDEIVISAPYEDTNRGAVYIYSGADLLKNDDVVKYMQRIQGDAPGQYFGLSLAPLQDFDENGCNELAIGAPENNTVNLLPCIATVIVNFEASIPDLTSKPSELSRTNASFFFNPCLNVERNNKPKVIVSRILVTVGLIHPHVRMEVNGAQVTNVSYVANLWEIHDNDKYCKSIQIFLPSDADYDLPIKFNLTARLMDDPLKETKFNPNLVLFHETSEPHKNVSAKINFNSVLDFEVHHSLPDSYLIGSKDTEKIKIVVVNAGHVAYKPSVRVRMVGVGVYDMPSACHFLPDSDVMMCMLASSRGIRRGESWVIDITLNTMALTSEDELISFEVFDLYNHGIRAADRVYRKNVTLAHDAVFSIAGSESSFSMAKDTFLKSGRSNILHDYTVINSGVSTWKNLKCVVVLQPNTNSMVSVGDEECTKKDGNSAECIIKLLKKNELININVVIDIPAHSPLLDQVANDKANISTHLTLFYDDKSMSASIFTTVKLISVSVPTWIIIVACLVAILVIIVLAWSLHECGCLRRKNKEELQKLKKDVQRQSIRRSMRLRESMIEVVASQQDTDDCKRLVGLPEHIDCTNTDRIDSCYEVQETNELYDTTPIFATAKENKTCDGSKKPGDKYLEASKKVDDKDGVNKTTECEKKDKVLGGHRVMF